MIKDEALKLALEALKNIDRAMPFPVAKLAIKECEAALEAKDEPVMEYPNYTPGVGWRNVSPPKPAWVGLTADEYAELAEEYGPFPINQIEAKLKEKNA